MTFDVAADGYDRFIGRYSRALSPRFILFAGVRTGPVIDVGCGPGSLTEALAQRFGASAVAAVDPSGPFVAACQARVPGADVRLASGEQLPFRDGSFSAALCQLVISFVTDPNRVLAEMKRVVRSGGWVSACSFEATGFALVRTFWQAALRFDPSAPDDAGLPFRQLSELVGLWESAGLQDVASERIDIEAHYADFEDYWAPFSFGIGPAAAYLRGQTLERRAAIRDACFELLGSPPGPFSLPAHVIAVRGQV